MSGHESVLTKEVIEGLNIIPDGNYVDGTFGRGGHSYAILEKLSDKGLLISVDKDLDAIAYGAAHISANNFILEHASYTQLKSILEEKDLLGKVNGLLLDLGVSSPQLDEATRGFSFMKEGPLDMRFDVSRGQSAADWINKADGKEIADVLYKYGEERLSKRIARAIVSQREDNPFTSTTQLANCIKNIYPKGKQLKHPATRSFQAIRIFINNELGELETVLNDALDILAPQGRLVVISFHSLEDRIVKHFMKTYSEGEKVPIYLPIKVEDLRKGPLKRISRAIKASPNEINQNVRARSAVLRVAEIQK